MDTLKTVDGLTLQLRRWPAAGAARGTVQLVHGLGEHVGRYEWLAGQLNAIGWHVVAHDQHLGGVELPQEERVDDPRDRHRATG